MTATATAVVTVHGPAFWARIATEFTYQHEWLPERERCVTTVFRVRPVARASERSLLVPYRLRLSRYSVGCGELPSPVDGVIRKRLHAARLRRRASCAPNEHAWRARSADPSASSHAPSRPDARTPDAGPTDAACKVPERKRKHRWLALCIDIATRSKSSFNLERFRAATTGARRLPARIWRSFSSHVTQIWLENLGHALIANPLTRAIP